MESVLYGRPVADKIVQDLKVRSEELRQNGIIPALAIIRVGENPGDIAYENGATKKSEQSGLEVKKYIFPEEVSNEELMAVIKEINEDDSIHGALLLRPLPSHLDERNICEALTESKDIDGMTRNSLATVFSGRGEGFAPCTARACVDVLDHYDIDVAGKNIVIVGRSLVIGKPLAMLLLARNATVTMCHSRTKDLAGICREADILVMAAGQAKMADRSFTNTEQIVVDVGINLDEDGSLCGDFDSGEDDMGFVKAFTPVPGGVGSVTSAVLCKHVIEAAEKTAGWMK